jgi:hypothetical protein
MDLLHLFEAPEGPVLVDFPDDEPVSEDDLTILACPVDFTQGEVGSDETDQLQVAFHREITAMRPWYDMALNKRQRTTVGISGIDISELGNFIYDFIKGVEPENPRDDVTLSITLKLAVEDLKAYYSEGITAQPGQEGISSKVIKDWFWDDTVAGKVILNLVKIGEESQDEEMKNISTHYLAPLDVIRRIKR